MDTEWIRKLPSDQLPAYFVGVGFGWLMYGECRSCKAAAKHPCVGSPYAPHRGRPVLWKVAA